MGSRRYCSEQIRSSLASNIRGWMPATGEKIEARTGWRGHSDGVWISSSAPARACPKGSVLMRWAEQWLHEGVVVDWEKLSPPKGFVVLPRRWVVERSFAWIAHNRRMSKDYERLCASSEAFVYAGMSRLMVRRLACA